jgi:glutamate racemase
MPLSMDAGVRMANAASGTIDARGRIAVFDSGVGGLSVLGALQQRLPHESFIYVADGSLAPYGDRPEAFVRQRLHQIALALEEAGAKALVLACNTASVVAAASLRRAHMALPIVAMEPAIKPAAARSRSGVLAVLATTATVASPSVQRLCREHAAGCRVVLQACPGLVEQVEAGQLDSADTRALVQRYLQEPLAAGADTIVLGCTHYPFLLPLLTQLAGPGIAWIEPSPAVAAQLERRLREARRLADPAAQALPLEAVSTGRVSDMQRFMDSRGLGAVQVQHWDLAVSDAWPGAPGLPQEPGQPVSAGG